MRKNAVVGIALMLPSLLLIGGLIIYPILYNFWLSLFNRHAFMPIQKFIGFRNYAYFASDLEFWDSFRNGVVYAGTTITLQVIIGLLAALLLNESLRGRRFIRAAVLFPYMIPTIVAVILWKWLLNDSYGLVNFVLLSVGIVKDPVPWLGRNYIMFSLILVSVWQFFPFVILSILARLQTIPPELYEAATVDGANVWYRFFHITLPQIRNVLFVVILLRSIWMFTKFDTVWLMGGEGAVGRFIRTMPVYAYMRSFTYLQSGMGATLAVIMFFLLMGATFVYFRRFRQEEAL